MQRHLDCHSVLQMQQAGLNHCLNWLEAHCLLLLSWDTLWERGFDLHNKSPAKLYSLHCHLYNNVEGFIIPASLFPQLSAENYRKIKAADPAEAFQKTYSQCCSSLTSCSGLGRRPTNNMYRQQKETKEQTSHSHGYTASQTIWNFN